MEQCINNFLDVKLCNDSSLEPARMHLCDIVGVPQNGVESHSYLQPERTTCIHTNKFPNTLIMMQREISECGVPYIPAEQHPVHHISYVFPVTKLFRFRVSV
jgi:hypothetical protein